MVDTTTIQMPTNLKKELESFKEYSRETYADVIRRLLENMKQNEESMLELNKETLKGIEEAKDDIKKSRLYTTKQLKKELGLK